MCVAWNGGGQVAGLGGLGMSSVVWRQWGQEVVTQWWAGVWGGQLVWQHLLVSSVICDLMSVASRMPGAALSTTGLASTGCSTQRKGADGCVVYKLRGPGNVCMLWQHFSAWLSVCGSGYRGACVPQLWEEHIHVSTHAHERQLASCTQLKAMPCTSCGV
jgi:hypothetical protein